MTRAMTTAMNTMGQLQKQLDIISNNIANVDTNGFKKRDVSFSELVYQHVNNQPDPEKETGRLSPLGIRQGVGAKIAKSAMILQQGPIKSTDRPLDIAFTEENQFLKVQVQENNEIKLRFTRNGSLYVTPSGNNEVTLVTSEGYPVLDENDDPIVFSNEYNEFIISNQGTLQVQGEGIQPVSFQLGVVTVHKPQFLEQKGETLLGLPENIDANPALIYTNIVGTNRNQIAMQQGALEGSNVDLSKEMSDMLVVQRSIQFQSRAISLSDQMMGLINGIR
ncbi:flagellar hook-basal body protein [Bacillus sp. FJAT-50079]|uniref:flagellar hook-basal body protein n=1 Tax=Bacillus sp. FJAT-50079 TaxID=2833577 RepID=UPI001BC98CC8|nr:flagellar hook-basal body protein [Bacillus sp. FJAT-50079]MBS4206779.1 flagellar hook-basal body protein [Bacillus sp. FJAT-50079]